MAVLLLQPLCHLLILSLVNGIATSSAMLPTGASSGLATSYGVAILNTTTASITNTMTAFALTLVGVAVIIMVIITLSLMPADLPRRSLADLESASPTFTSDLASATPTTPMLASP